LGTIFFFFFNDDGYAGPTCATENERTAL
jgi:hypothetical protein